MRAWILTAAIASALAAAPAHAVTLAARGGGQVLLFPFYSVDRGLQTLVSIVNSTDRGKAVRVNFVEGRNNRSVLPFNLYLAPHDSWTGAVIALQDDGPAALLTLDRSCTVPRIVDSTVLPQFGGGPRYAAFRNYDYSGDRADDGTTSLERTREGSIEVIELGTIVPHTATADVVAYGADGLRGCAPLSDAFAAADGYWRADPSTNLTNPTGGLYGSASLVDVANGRMWAYDATAIDDFRGDPADVPRGSRKSVVLHSAEFFGTHPSLADAVTDPENDIAGASVAVDGGIVRVEYPADTRGYDAVSAVLMSATIDNDFIVEPALGARSEWVVGFPTRQFYADSRLVAQTPVAPFTSLSGFLSDNACESLDAHDRDREGRESECVPFPEPPADSCPPALRLCFATQSIPFSDHRIEPTTSADSFLGPALATTFARYALDTRFLAGALRIDLVTDRSRPQPPIGHRLRPALDGTTFEGLPAVGFLAVEYANSNALPGLLGNYTGTYAHRFHARCTRGDGTPCRP